MKGQNGAPPALQAPGRRAALLVLAAVCTELVAGATNDSPLRVGFPPESGQLVADDSRYHQQVDSLPTDTVRSASHVIPAVARGAHGSASAAEADALLGWSAMGGREKGGQWNWKSDGDDGELGRADVRSMEPIASRTRGSETNKGDAGSSSLRGARFRMELGGERSPVDNSRVSVGEEEGWERDAEQSWSLGSLDQGLPPTSKRRRRARWRRLKGEKGSREDNDDEVDGSLGTVGQMAFLICFGLLFCVMEVAKCYCLLEFRRRQRARRERERNNSIVLSSQAQLPIAISRPALPVLPETGGKEGFVEVVVDGVSLSAADSDTGTEMPSVRGLPLAQGSHPMLEAAEDAQRVSPRSMPPAPPVPGDPPAIVSRPGSFTSLLASASCRSVTVTQSQSPAIRRGDA